MNVRTGIILVWFFSCSFGTEAAAQRPLRNGFWMESGAGTGSARIGCTSCETPVTAFGESGYTRGGGQLSERVLWGIEIFGLLDDTFGLADGDSTLTVENLSLGPVVLWYPWQSEVFVKAGLGITRGRILLPDENGKLVLLTEGTGSSLTFGLGFDIPILKWLALTVNFGAYFAAIGDVVVQETYVDDVIITMYNANFAVTIR